MGGEGAMMQAIKSLAYNKSLRNKFNRASWKNYKTSNDKPLVDHIKASPELLASIRTRLQAENKNRKKRQILLILLSIIIAILLIYTVSKMNWIGIQLDF